MEKSRTLSDAAPVSSSVKPPRTISKTDPTKRPPLCRIIVPLPPAEVLITMGPNEPLPLTVPCMFRVILPVPPCLIYMPLSPPLMSPSALMVTSPDVVDAKSA